MSGQAPPPICDYEDSDYQDRFWGGGERAYEDRVEAVAIRRLLPGVGGRWLEIGAGAGRNSLRYRGFKRLVLLDYSYSQLRKARQALPQGPYAYVQADAYFLPFAPGTFEAATMIRTLHHMVEPVRALAQVRRALVEGGRLLLEYPNKRNLKSILRWLLRRQGWNPFSPEPVEFARLNFDFHPRQVRRWLRTAGFAVERELSVSHFRLRLLKRWLPLGWLVALDSAAQLSGRWWQLAPSVFLRAVAASGVD